MGIFLKKWALTIIAFITFAWLTLAPHPLPDNNIGAMFENTDKVVHALMLWGITCAIIFDYKRAGNSLSWRVAAVIFISMILVSIADELLQSAMHLGRTADILDFLADTIGIILGIITAPKIVTRILKHLKL